MGSDGRLWCYKRKGEKLSKRTVKPTVKHGGGSAIVWGCMSMQGVGRMSNIDGIMYSEDYVDILDDKLLPTVTDHGLRRGGYIFQQDNDPKHTSRMAKEWFKDHRVTVLDWPANSPDLNPIEHLWVYLKQQLNNYERFPTSMHELNQRIEAEWNKIPREECIKLIESLPRRIQQ
ncbi:2526_t:CDS:1, partial [Acaulospora colombiana]